ncbi:unnamed protein product [Brachionus calyciflorus]|uniref:Reverse transcriptase domain-containing protein n=1 Tax=Brachionus calyciflorus TaxID=104777 RepID=A0A814MYA2_9BILA|nr:unnamed protein product [Brachionus calyciflorus]
MLKYAGNLKLYDQLRSIFEIIIQSQVTPYLFNVSIIKLLLKDPKKSNTDLSNQRPIAISDSISNLFESVLLDYLNTEHKDHPKQFGFKANWSCQHAIWTLKQAIETCKRTNKWTYVCAIDASLAFDLLNRNKLWLELIAQKVNFTIIIALIKYYVSALILVNNDQDYSDLFKSEIGVRQGGKTSPKLFSIYTEKILRKISESEYRVRINKVKIDVIAYADDILLVSSIKRGLQELLDKVNVSGNELEIKFNPSKTIFIIFNHKIKRSASDRRDDSWQEPLKLTGEIIVKVESTKYLGVELNTPYKDAQHMGMLK